MDNATEFADTARAAVSRHADALLTLSHSVHGFAETNFQEIQSSAVVSDALSNHGFKVTSIDDYPTAFVATYGSGSLHIGICAEYDALPGVGHACGHNIIAAAAVGAGLALAEVASALDLTVSVLGTPAEEGGGGKIYMMQKGAFDGLHLAMMVHPSAIERDTMPTLAVSQFDVDFFGHAAHAAAQPDRGISASAALALAQVGIGMLREHLQPGDRLHGIVTNGGDAPNVVPEYTSGRWFIRARSMERLLALQPKVLDVFRGAALMTGCRVTMHKNSPTYTDIRPDETLLKLWTTAAAAVGRTTSPIRDDDPAASTDMGNVTYALPSIHPLIAIDSNGANIHEAAFARAAISPSGDQAVLDGAIAMAFTAIDVATNASLRARYAAHVYSAASDSDAAYLDRNFNNVITFDPKAN